MSANRLKQLLFLGGLIASVSACSSSGATPAATTATRFDAAGSWIAPAASKQPLLYVSDADGNVDIFSYPDGKPVGKLKGFSSPAGLCSDSAGDVYVVDTGLLEVLEYKHGGTTPTTSLFVMGYYPYGCAVDPTTGNVAVADYASQKQGAGGVSIFHPGQTFPSTYQDTAFNAYFFCSYDNNGNLFVDGADYGSYHTELAEMPSGSTSFTAISLDKTIVYPGGVMWDGTNLAIQDTTSRILYRFKIAGTKGKTAGSTVFNGDRTTLIHQFWIAGNSIVIPYGTTQRLVRKIGVWPYPGGGAVTKSFSVPRSTELVGVTLSAPHK
jgi:DNA-binding beta-propeller fold protein YncE